MSKPSERGLDVFEIGEQRRRILHGPPLETVDTTGEEPTTTWYMTSDYNLDITPVQVISETERYLTVVPTKYFRATRRLKCNDYHRTFSDARSYHMQRLSDLIDRKQREIAAARLDMSFVFKMEPPETL
jgi:hypothetical protein